jgi:N-formylglutamate amidohydrolase
MSTEGWSKCWVFHWQSHRQNWASSTAVEPELAASFESTVMPNCHSLIRPAAEAWAAGTAFDFVLGRERRGDRTILAVAVDFVAVVAAGGSEAVVADIAAATGSSFGFE